MRCSLPTLLTIITLATPLAGQAAAGHIYWVGFYQALPGKAAAYNKALSDIADPVLDELVRRKQMVSHVQLAQYTGAGENTNLVILEFPSWAALDTYLTIRLRLVAHLCRWSLRDGEGLREEHRVAVHDSAARLLDWLKQESSGRLDATSKRAWVRACAAWPGLKREAVERVD